MVLKHVAILLLEGGSNIQASEVWPGQALGRRQADVSYARVGWLSDHHEEQGCALSRL